jgi:hypothetical protein
MATGVLGTADLSAATNTTLYTCPADTFSVVSVNLCNRAATTRDVRIAVAAADTPTNAEYIEFDTEILANGVLERGGIVLGAGSKIVCYCNSTDMSAVVFGIETSLA